MPEDPNFKVARIHKPDGTVEDLRFPADIDDAKMQAAVKSYTSKINAPPGSTPIGLRAKLSFAENEAAQKKTLENLYGPDNVSLDMGGKLQYRERPDQQFRQVNPAGFDLGDLADYAGDAPEMILGTLGSIAGAAGGMGVGSFLGAGLGAAGGGAMGRGIKSTIGSMMGVPQPPPGQDIFNGAAVGAIGEAGGQAVTKIAGRLIAPFKAQVTPLAQAAIDWMDKYLPVLGGGTNTLKSQAAHAMMIDSPRLLPAEATESRMLDFLHNIAENSITGGGTIKAFKDQRQKMLGTFAADFANLFGQAPDPQILGTTVKQIVEGNYSAVHLPAQAMLNSVEQKAGNLMVDVRPFKKVLQGVVDDSAAINNYGSTLSGADMAATLAGLEDEIPLSAATKLRSILRAKGNEFSIANKKAPALGLAKRGTSMVDDAIGAALQKDMPGEYVEWRVANSLYKNAEGTFNNKFVRNLIKLASPDLGGQPESVSRAIFQNNKPSLVEATQRALDPPTFRQLTSYMLHDKLATAVGQDGMISAEKMLASTVGPKGLGEKTMRTTLGQNYDAFTGMLNAMKHAQAKQSSGTGSMFIQLAQSGAIIGAGGTIGGLLGGSEGAASGAMGTAAPVLIGPYMVAKLMTTRLGMRLFTEGFKLPAGSPLGMGIVGRLMALQSQMADVESLSDADAEASTTIPNLPTKRFNVAPGSAPQ